MNSKITRNCWVQLLVPAIAAYILLWVAIFNGYPLLFPDSGEYLRDSFTLNVPHFRPLFYPLFMRCTSFGISPWLVIFAQSGITVFVVHHSLNFAIGHNASSSSNTRMFLAVVLFLAAVTSLPWTVGELMPDVFAGLLILSMFLLLYDPELTLGTSAALALVIAIAVACHVSHLLISVFVLLAVGVFAAFPLTRAFRPTRSRMQIIVFVLTPILASGSAIALANWHAGLGFALSPDSHMLMVGRLFASGLAGDYLRQECRVEQLTACKYLDSLPSDETEFLWRENPLFKAMGGWRRSKQEATKIIFGTIRYSPGRFFGECVKQAARQFVSIKPGDENSNYAASLVEEFQRSFYPEDIGKIEVSKQSTGGLQKLVHLVSGLQVVVFWCSLAGSILFFIRRLGRNDNVSKLFAFASVALLANALVTGSLSNVANRYQSRVCWLVPFCFAAYALSVFSSVAQEFGHGDLAAQPTRLKSDAHAA